MAQQQASSASAVSLWIKQAQEFVNFVGQIPDKGPHQTTTLNSAVNELEQVMLKFQQYVNERASGIN